MIGFYLLFVCAALAAAYALGAAGYAIGLIAPVVTDRPSGLAIVFVMTGLAAVIFGTSPTGSVPAVAP